MNSILRGLLAGLFAGLILALLYLVDYGPGTQLHSVASWFALDNASTGRLFGFVLLIVLGGVFGVFFGLIHRGQQPTLIRAILSGLALGVIWWIVIMLALGNLVQQAPLLNLSFNSFLFFFTLALLYGMILGTAYFQSTVRREG